MSLPVTYSPGLAPPRPELLVACEQLARHWARFTAWPGGLTFAESIGLPGGLASPAANLWATPLPPRGERAEVAASLTILGSSPQSELEIAVRTAVLIEARCPSTRQAMALLTDLRRLVRPGERPLVYVPHWSGVGAVSLHGLLGLPEGAGLWPDASTIDLWRVLAVDMISEPAPISLQDSAQADLSAGQGVASMTLGLTMTPAALTAPSGAIKIWATTAAWASVEIAPGPVLTLRAGASEAAAATYTLDMHGMTVDQAITAAIGAAPGAWAKGPVVGGGFAPIIEDSSDRLEWRRQTTGHITSGAGAILRLF